MPQRQPPPPSIVNRLPDLLLMEVDCVRISVAVLHTLLESKNEEKKDYQERCNRSREKKRFLAKEKDLAIDSSQIFKLKSQLEDISNDLRCSEDHLRSIEQEISTLQEHINWGSSYDEFEVSLTLRFRTHSYRLDEGKQIDFQLMKGLFYVNTDGASMPLSRIRDEQYLSNDKFVVVYLGTRHSPEWEFRGKNGNTLDGRFERTVLGDLEVLNIGNTNLKFGFRVPDYLTSLKISNLSSFTSKTDINSIKALEHELKVRFLADTFHSDLSYLERSI